jgi:hypothetical protein
MYVHRPKIEENLTKKCCFCVACWQQENTIPIWVFFSSIQKQGGKHERKYFSEENFHGKKNSFLPLDL